MKLTHRIAALAAGTAMAATGAIAAAPAASAAAPLPEIEPNSLAAVLTSDGNQFDRNWYDFDIVTEAAIAVLHEKPDSLVKVLFDEDFAATAFIPNDRAFQVLLWDVAKKWVGNEADVFAGVASLGIDTVEQVLLYHVVPGATIDSSAALQADNAVLTTAQGGTITVDVLSERFKLIRLKDADRNDFDPWIVRSKFDINKGNPQIAHGIGLVLRPADL